MSELQIKPFPYSKIILTIDSTCRLIFFALYSKVAVGGVMRQCNKMSITDIPAPALLSSHSQIQPNIQHNYQGK